MSLAAGTRLGSYEVLAPLGAGGMGEVYRARDTKLGRDVAIKILPESLASDPDRLMRFEREAKTLASLNHPNIAAIYGIEERALVMELVEGEDLSARIARGPIPLDEALPIAKQIAEALEAAHEQGIIHRDLKPANIKVRPDGTVKVLDFGLAKALDQGSGPAHRSLGEGGLGDQRSGHRANSPTITSPAMTMHGVILGTAAYMSPEQAKGKPVDKRADIWAFGCVLFEMLTGRTPFTGETITDIIAEIVKGEPKWQALDPSMPPRICTLLERCLRKDPRARLRDIGDARLELDGGTNQEAPVMAATASARGRAWVIAPWVVAAAAGVALAVVAGPRTPAPTADPGVVTRFELTVPDGYMRMATRAASMSLSNDGTRLAFIAVNSTNRGALFMRDMSSLEPKLLQVATVAWATPSWSPDGRYVVITAALGGIGGTDPGQGGTVRRLDPAGGPPTTLAEWGRYPLWGSAGTIVFGGRDGRLYRVPEAGGDSTAITELDATAGEVAHIPSSFLPDGRGFIFMVQNRDSERNAMFLASIDGGPRTPLAVPATRVVYAGGWLWSIQNSEDRALVAQRMDAATGRLEGGPRSVASGVADFAVSASGALVIAPRDNTTLRMAWLDRQGAAGPAVADPDSYGAVFAPNLSPDGKRMIFIRPDAGGQPHVWQADLERNVSTRFATTPNSEDAAVYSPDGRHVVFSRGTGDLYRRAADGSGSDELLRASATRQTPTAISPDGAVLLFTQSSADTGPDIWSLPLTGERIPRPLVITNALEGNARFSPDGRWFAYCAGLTGEPDHVFVEPYPPTGARTRLSAIQGSSPRWSADGREIYYGTPSGQIMRVSVTMSGGTVRAGVAESVVTAPLLFSHNAFVLDARSRILALSPESNRRPEPPTVILNWPSLIKAGPK